MHRNCTGTALELHWNVNSNWIQHKSQFMRHYLRIWWVVIDAVIWWRRNASLYEFHFLLLKIIFLPLLLRSCCLCRLRRWLQVSPGDKLLQSNVSLVIIPSDLLKKRSIIYRICRFEFRYSNIRQRAECRADFSLNFFFHLIWPMTAEIDEMKN